MRLYFFRHGKTSGNEKKQYIGITDQPLSVLGIAELKERSVFQDVNLTGIHKVYVSPLQRCRETASLYFPFAEQIIIEGLKEMNFGIFEEKNYIDLENVPQYKEWLDTMCEGPVPEGETKADFQKRVVQAFLKATQTFTTEKTAVFVIHGGSIMSLFDYFTDSDRSYYDWYINNGYYYAADWEDGKFTNIYCSDPKVNLINA